MGRILAIDYGTKRIGIAVSDPLKIIATPLLTIPNKDAIRFLEKYFLKEEVDTIVVGDPSGHNRNAGISKLANEFCRNLKKKFPDKIIERINEFYTSKMALRTMIDAGLKKSARQNKALIDKISAAIILKDFLDKN